MKKAHPSDVSVTLEIYSHADIDSQRACLNVLKNVGI